MVEAPLEDSGSGLAPAGDGWFVVNVRDAQWLTSETEGGGLRSSGSECAFEGRNAEFSQFGFRLHVLEPGEPNGLYHWENQQEAFLVLSGECRLLVEGAERLLRQWDFFHSPAGTEHIFVGAGDGPCVILMAGARMGDHWQVLYPVSELAVRYGASAKEETSDRARRTWGSSRHGASGPRTGTASPGPSPEHAFDRMNAPGRYIWRGDVEPASRKWRRRVRKERRSAQHSHRQTALRPHCDRNSEPTEPQRGDRNHGIHCAGPTGSPIVGPMA